MKWPHSANVLMFGSRPHPGGNELFETILAVICVENHVRLVDFISYSIWVNMLGIRMGVDLLNYKKELCVSLQAVNIMHTQNRYLQICIYWKLPIYLMSSVWNFDTSSQISITAFSNHIKHHILESYNYECIELNWFVCNSIESWSDSTFCMY